jgi:hypothetical protein
LDGILSDHPDWRVARVVRARLARAADALMVGESDAGILIEYVGQGVTEYLDLLDELKPLVHPGSLPSILYSNALKLHESGDREGTVASIELAIEAAERAVDIGDVAETMRCLGFVELRLSENETDNNRFRKLVDHCASRVTRLLDASKAVTDLVNANSDAYAAEFKPDYEGKTVVIFGGMVDDERDARLRHTLGLSSLVSITWNGLEAPNPNKLLEHSVEESVLVVISVDDVLIPGEVRLKLRQRRVSFCRSIDNLASILQSLKSLVRAPMGVDDFVPGTCAEALEWARMRCPKLEFCPTAGKRIDELDENVHAEKVRKRIVSDLDLLNRYAIDARAGNARSGMKNWLALHGFNTQYYAPNESQTTSNNPRAREERTFRCSKGRLFMPEHLKLPGEYPTEARMHFSSHFAAQDGIVIIGYVGPHLYTP